MNKLIEDEIKKFKPFAAQLQFEGASLNEIFNTLIKQLIIKIKQTERHYGE